MIEAICDQLRDKAAQLSFVSRAYGLVRETQMSLEDGSTKRLPTYKDAFVTPDAQESAVVWFEQLGAIVPANTNLLRLSGFMVATVRVVVWVNGERVDKEPSNACFSALRSIGKNTTEGMVLVPDQIVTGADALGSWSWSEAENQLSYAPYYIAAQNFRITFRPALCEVEPKAIAPLC